MRDLIAESDATVARGAAFVPHAARNHDIWSPGSDRVVEAPMKKPQPRPLTLRRMAFGSRPIPRRFAAIVAAASVAFGDLRNPGL
jgi:hypothetical protein